MFQARRMVKKVHDQGHMSNGHLQTALAAYKGFEDRYLIQYQRELLSTPDGGTVSIDWAPSFETMPVDETPTPVTLYGLTDGSHESYIRSLIETVTRDYGYRCVVFNARACANTELTSAQLYSGAWTEDLRLAVKHIRQTLPKTKLMSIGLSFESKYGKRKLDPFWYRPLQVVRVTPLSTYQLKWGNGELKNDLVHQDRLELAVVPQDEVQYQAWFTKTRRSMESFHDNTSDSLPDGPEQSVEDRRVAENRELQAANEDYLHHRAVI
ncbi:hypothetical protein BGZ52_002078, partial [Haplosporangium bisporale]